MPKDEIIEAVQAARDETIRTICRNFMTAGGKNTEDYEEAEFEALVQRMALALEPFHVESFR
jgi:hypothetical protein